MADSDDDLSHTATDHARGKPADTSGNEATLPATPDAKRDSSSTKSLPAKIGKYRIERELGAGGMGVVYVAFDPDLERRIALKVLRAATSSEAAQRLQREARAMARLKHGNVVTVHEVATANGRDYVAMEMIDGETLADWLRDKKRSQAEIVDAFVQAGRGLAAAHAAGLVHRDFKPHNVLRDRAGHVSVTDFGLAREAVLEGSDPLAATMPLSADASTSGTSKSSSLAGLTVTGALLGTPAYMAPEQWTGGAVTAATDQFAYCVALWEAVTGARPFTGPTVDMLRAQILEGAAELDASVVPKELRAPLMRGLDADPKKRWQSMDALLAAIAPPPKRSTWSPLRALAAVAAIIVATLILLQMRRPPTPPAKPALACPVPARAMTNAWSAATRQSLVDKKRTLAVMQLDADAKAWTAARETACASSLDARPTQLACLDAVMARFDVAAATVAARDDDHPLDAGAVLVDPTLCTSEHPPHLSIPSVAMREAMVTEIEQKSGAKATALDMAAKLVDLPDKIMDDDPCASMYTHLHRAVKRKSAAERRPEVDRAEQGFDRCTDERARADGALALLGVQLRDQFAAASVEKKLRQAQIAVELVMQPDLRAMLDTYRATIAARKDDIVHAMEFTDAATAGFVARMRVPSEIAAGLEGVAFHQLRATPEDLVDVHRRLDALEKRARDLLGESSDEVREVRQTAAYWSFVENDVAGSHARLTALQKQSPIASPITVSGKVVDEKGAPVAGATVVAGGYFSGDEVSIALPAPVHAAGMRTVTTGADGTFTLEAVRDGIVVAQRGDLRSGSAATGPNVVLTLRPTSHVEGKVELHGVPSVSTLIAFFPVGQEPLARYAVAAAVAPDGTFHSDGVPRGKVKIDVIVNSLLGQTMDSVTVDVNRPSVSGIQLRAPSNRTVYILLRSSVGQPLENAQVLVQSGTITATNLQELRASKGKALAMRLALPLAADLPPDVRALSRDGDLFVKVTGAPTDAGTSCAIPLPSDISDLSKLQRSVEENTKKIPTACKPLPADSTVLLQDVPPWPRLE